VILGVATFYQRRIAGIFLSTQGDSKLVKKGAAELPERTLKWEKPGRVNDLRMYELLKTPTSSGEAIRSLAQTKTLDSNGYALAWGLVHFLASQRAEVFQAYLRDVSQLQPLQSKMDDAASRPDPCSSNTLATIS
jgi:hypothetical protein